MVAWSWGQEGHFEVKGIWGTRGGGRLEVRGCVEGIYLEMWGHPEVRECG